MFVSRIKQVVQIRGAMTSRWSLVVSVDFFVVNLLFESSVVTVTIIVQRAEMGVALKVKI